ncbi:ComEC/Rec2 family competence protein [Candidatus Peregrinibacteria bacterium]|nr:MAG: ComEC/Rec2 family competence protein [Candidatus Peregrinibacteria bacterium]
MLLNLAFASAFLLGVSLESFIDVPMHYGTFLWLCPVLFLLRKKPLFCLLFFVLGIGRVQHYEASLQTSFKGGFQSVHGVIGEEVDRRSAFQNISLYTEEGEVLAQVSIYEDLEFGDELELQGELELRSAMEEEVGSYKNYLARQGVVALMSDATVKIKKEGENSFRRQLYRFKSILERRLQLLLPEPESSFAAGLLLGSRKGMSPELTTAFRTVGLLHIVAISGANISLVIATVFTLLSFLMLRWRIVASVAVLAIFVLLVGATSTVIRAAVMGVLTLWGLYFGRRSTALFGLLWSVVLLVFWNPYLLLFDVGFQLSVLSTLGLLVFVPVLEGRLTFMQRLPAWTASLKEALFLTIAAQITTLPLMLYCFGQTSWVTPFVNVLVAPLLPLAMLTAFLGLLFPFFMAPAWAFLAAIEKLALWGAELPAASLSFTLSLSGLFWLYVLECFFLLRFYKPTLVRAFFRDPSPLLHKESIPLLQRHEKPSECQV